MPDGNIIRLGKERFKVAEPIFKPELLGREAPGLGEIIGKSIANTGIDVRRFLWSNIICAGGNTMFPGIEQRAEAEISNWCPERVRHTVDVVIPTNRAYSAWLGGSVLASLESFKEMWVLKYEYEDEGLRVVERFG